MTLIDRTQFQRQAAIVDMLGKLPAYQAWHALSEIPIEAQNELYDALRVFERTKCDECDKPLGEDDVDLCEACADRMEQILSMQQMMNRSGVVFGEHL